MTGATGKKRHRPLGPMAFGKGELDPPKCVRLALVAETLLVAVFFHALAALVLRDFGFSFLFE